MKTIVLCSVSLLIGANFNTAVLSVASRLSTMAGEGIRLAAQQLIQWLA